MKVDASRVYVCLMSKNGWRTSSSHIHTAFNLITHRHTCVCVAADDDRSGGFGWFDELFAPNAWRRRRCDHVAIARTRARIALKSAHQPPARAVVVRTQHARVTRYHSSTRELLNCECSAGNRNVCFDVSRSCCRIILINNNLRSLFYFWIVQYK